MLTVKQIADRAGVSKTTVTKYLKAYEADHSKEAAEQITKNEQNIIQVSDELAEQLLEAILNQKENRKPTANPEESPQTVCTNPTANPEKVCTNPPPTPANFTANPQTLPPTVSANPPQTANPDTIDALNKVIETQQAQIEQLKQDKHDLKEDYETQIQRAEQDKANLQKQIDQLNILLSQQQQIHQTLQVKLLETEQTQEPAEAEPTEQPKKKGLFGIFKKK